MKEIFLRKISQYDLRINNRLQVPKYKTVAYGKQSVAYIGSFLWNTIADEVKVSETICKFKTLIKNWKGETCSCKLCTPYIAQIGFFT